MKKESKILIENDGVISVFPYKEEIWDGKKVGIIGSLNKKNEPILTGDVKIKVNDFTIDKK